MGDAAQALEQASLVDRRKRAYEMFAEHFEQIDAVRELFDALGWEHIELNPPEIEGVEIDLDEYREALEAGLDEATMMLRAFTEEGRAISRRFSNGANRSQCEPLCAGSGRVGVSRVGALIG
jgi:hypothetical protein